MWTRLLYISAPNAFKAQLVDGKWHRAIVSGRYKGVLKKSFREAGVPWTYENKTPGVNPRHKTPKGHSYEKAKPIRLAKIKKALEQQPEMITKYRQEAMDKRKLSGFDYAIKMALPSFMTQKREDTMTESRSRVDLEGIEGQLRRKTINYNKRNRSTSTPGSRPSEE